MKSGAYDYVTKPVDWNKLKVILKNAMTIRSLRKKVDRLQNQLRSKYENANIIGSGPKMREVYQSLDRVIDSDVTVIILGESGTGKELLARAIHFNGHRKEMPFVAVNCAAIPETLLESELFGHEKGSFTGAMFKRVGKFEQAHRGTIFLDEIGEMSKPTQAKILRVLQEKRIERVGGNTNIDVDVRILSATNKNLEDEIKKGNFREDLFYRLSVYPVRLPPLRERREDIPQLVAFFLDKFNKRMRRKVKSVSDRALEHLMNYSWPGNVAELKNVINRAVLICNGNILRLEHIELQNMVRRENILNLKGFDLLEAKEIIEEELIKEALNRADYNKSKAAELLGFSRKTLYTKLEKHGLE
jgi:two-component system response regulator AtoC